MTNIVSIIPYKILPARLGGEKGIALFTEYLGKLIPITGISTKNNDPVAAKNFQMLNILSNSRIRYANVFLYFTIRKIIRQENASHLLIEHPYYGWLAWLLRKTLPVKFVVHSHNIEYMRSKSIGRWWWKALQWYESWVYRKADTVFFISEDDMKHAVTTLGIDARKSHPITYGVEVATIPPDINESRTKVCSLHSIPADTRILLFNGALYHHSNYDAVSVIVDIINPVLLRTASPYKIIICGKGLPDSFGDLKPYAGKNIIYAGFVDDIDIYFKAADVFLNPITTGGGVKTKAIEAIAMNCTVISTEFGAMGLKREVCGEKLQVVNDRDWNAFAKKVEKVLPLGTNTPNEFYDHYYWGNIAAKVAAILTTNERELK